MPNAQHAAAAHHAHQQRCHSTLSTTAPATARPQTTAHSVGQVFVSTGGSENVSAEGRSLDSRCRPSADGGDRQLPGISPGHARAVGDQVVDTRRWAHEGRHPQVGAPEGNCDAARGLRPLEVTTSGASRATHWPAAEPGARRAGPLRTSPAGTDHAVSPGAAARRDLLRRGRGGSRSRPAAIREGRVRRLPRSLDQMRKAMALSKHIVGTKQH
jgi:hypothetical protein